MSSDIPSRADAKTPLKPRHVPERTCVACRQVKAKRELVRIVCSAAGTVEVDLSGKKTGRGVYLCRARSCWETGLKKNRLDHAFRKKIDHESASQLLEYIETLPLTPEGQES